MKTTLNMVMRNDVKTLGRETIDGLMLEGILLHGCLIGFCGEGKGPETAFFRVKKGKKWHARLVFFVCCIFCHPTYESPIIIGKNIVTHCVTIFNYGTIFCSVELLTLKGQSNKRVCGRISS